MKQIIQDLKSGNTILEEVPCPKAKSGSVLIRTTKSLVSLGTERMLVEFGKANLIEKARQQPDKVTMVLDKIKTDGLQPTLEAVFNKLNQPLPLGYCNVGEVIDVGKGVKELRIGDRVASNGHHAEFVSVPENLAVKIPENVTDEEAAFTVIGAIGLQGIRLLNPTLGETTVVIGLGLIGLLTAQLLKANGCQVVGFDFDQSKIDIAQKLGINAIDLSSGVDQVKVVEELTNQRGADGVIITASNKSSEIISNAAKMSRKRGRIILVGVIGLDISRADFYEKELTFQVSCSYGPGRYDEQYEQKGQDYPLPYVRWTERRNFSAILEAVSQGSVDVKPLISEIVPLEEFDKIYESIGASRSIASILSYSQPKEISRKIQVTSLPKQGSRGDIGVIGAGNFTNAMILPSLKKVDASVKYIASSGGLTAKTLAKKFKIEFASSDYEEMLDDQALDLVLITTRHNAHASMTIESLKKGKHVFVEKPLALNIEDIDKIAKEVIESEKSVVVGFNRRFSPHMMGIKNALADSGPIHVVATMNAGFIPKDVWIHDMEIGGGRIIGEACHYIDLIAFLTGSQVKSVCMNAMGQNPEENSDNASILLRFENGSNGVINYFANGSKSYSKERVEVFSQERTFVCDNFRITKGFGAKGFKKIKTKQDKGHLEQFRRLNDFAQNGGEPIISFDEIVNVSKASVLCVESLKKGTWMNVE